MLDHYDTPIGKNRFVNHPSYQLRDPKLVAWLKGLAKKLSPEKQSQPEITALRKALIQIHGIVDIDIDA